jgi:hypothetical protein
LYNDPKLDRIFVAASIQCTPQGSSGLVVNGVRLFSSSIDVKPTKLSLATVHNYAEMATTKAAEPPHAQVSLLPHTTGYSVDLAFIDNASQINTPVPVLGYDGQVRLARSFDYGLTATAHTVTGCLAPNCAQLGQAMGLSRYGRLALTADTANDKTVIAVEDLENEIIHVLYGSPSQKHVEWFDRTATGDFRPEFAPRMACAEGRFSMTCLTGDEGSYTGNKLIWYDGRLAIPASFNEHVTPLHLHAMTPGDIDVRGGDAWIVAGCLPDWGGAAVATVFEGSRSDPFLALPSAVVPDDGLSVGTPRVGVSPKGTPKMGSYFFQRPKTPAYQNVRMDP